MKYECNVAHAINVGMEVMSINTFPYKNLCVFLNRYYTFKVIKENKHLCEPDNVRDLNISTLVTLSQTRAREPHGFMTYDEKI